MSVEDKIRRAEEIYNRRRERDYKVTNTRLRVDNTKEKSNSKIDKRLKKMIIQIITCMLIYLTFYYAINNNYIFSEDLKKKCEEILAYDISFSEMYKRISGAFVIVEQKYQEVINNVNKEQVTEESDEQGQNEQNVIQDENIQEENSNENIIQEETLQNQESSQIINEPEAGNENQEKLEVEENIGGAVENTEQVISNVEENLTEEEQMKKDAEEIKAQISFIKPLSGVITSVFGWRNPTVSTVSKYHTGIDIAANEGTDIKSATNGTVMLASSKGAYGNHLKIKINDVIIIYAHCLSLEVKEGDEIVQGQVIAKVGSTGNSTGPHLHFEIRKEDRYVNPDLILDF